MESVLGKRQTCNNSRFFDIRAIGTEINYEIDDGLGNYLPQIFTKPIGTTFVTIIRKENTFFIYHDGKLVSDNKLSINMIDISNNSPLGISSSACIGVDGTSMFSGSIDDLRIYNRALTEAEVLELYEGKEKVASSIDLSLALTAPTSVKTSEKATYQLTATNNGNTPATGVKAHFVVPRKSIATVDIPKNCTLNGRIIECAMSDLGANQSATQTFSMTVLRKGALSVVGLVNSSADDANYDDNKKSAVVSVK